MTAKASPIAWFWPTFAWVVARVRDRSGDLARICGLRRNSLRRRARPRGAHARDAGLRACRRRAQSGALKAGGWRGLPVPGLDVLPEFRRSDDPSAMRPLRRGVILWARVRAVANAWAGRLRLGELRHVAEGYRLSGIWAAPAGFPRGFLLQESATFSSAWKRRAIISLCAGVGFVDMGKPAARVAAPERVLEADEDRMERGAHVRRDCAVEVLCAGRRYLVLTDRRGLAHAQEVMSNGALGNPLADDEFDALHDAFPWAPRAFPI